MMATKIKTVGEMVMSRLFVLVLGVCLSPLVSVARERTVIGRVVDRNGSPVANASVATLMRSNGPATKKDGTEYDLGNPAENRQFWGSVGQMAPFSPDQVTTDEDGRFTIKLGERRRALFAIGQARVHGCIVEVPKEIRDDEVLELRLERLVTVSGSFRSNVKSKPAEWCHVYVELPVNPRNPLASNRILTCGSFDGKFEFRLPPGKYRLDAYGTSEAMVGEIDLQVRPAPFIEVQASNETLNVGELELSQAEKDSQQLAAESKASGRWGDYTQHYGEPAPSWHAVDSRGIGTKENIDSLRGKWVLIDFWGLSCAPCLASGIPKLMDFYDRHKKLRGDFEIIGVCIDYSGKMRRVEDLDKALVSIEKHAWNGKKIPFPIVLDNTFKTWERYGIPGLGTVVLVDPQGRIVEGGEQRLEEILEAH